jgi:Brp/Blh family beta-carotene 15,15'-monooxygenase
MTSRYPLLYRTIQGLAVFFILLSLLLPSFLEQSQLVLAVSLILLIGIPHGATDYLIFKYLSRPLWGTKQLKRFYINYILLMAGYGILWFFLPIVALSLFIILSVYHFGQSNWNYVPFRNKWESTSIFMLWGAFVVLMPVFWHFEDSAVIISTIIGSEVPALSSYWLRAICLSFLVLNVGIAFLYHVQAKISRKELIDELLNLLILGLVFVSTPVLLGFAIYFVFWHSLSSVMDQIRFFRIQLKSYSWKHYIKNTIPLSIAAIIGLVIMGMAQMSLGIPLNIGIVFVFISIVTLPHMILIEQLYNELTVEESE